MLSDFFYRALINNNCKKQLKMAITEFQKKVYYLCREIPKGKVSTYKAIAEKIGNKSYRAIGNALNKNPFAPEVPCHRVVLSNGSIGGFANGKKAKIKLLEKEGVKVEKNKIVDFNVKLF